MKNELLLSLFPGIDLFGRAFEAEGYCVVRGPDLITGGDIRNFKGVRNRFDGVFGGSPCPGFSAANRQRKNPDHPSVKLSHELLGEFMRVVGECKPMWFMLENVPGVPDVTLQGYHIQRIPISDLQCGGKQIRVRHIQFGHLAGCIIRPERVNDVVSRGITVSEATTCRQNENETFADHCRKQGFKPEDIKLPGFTKQAKFRAVGNGVPLRMGTALAKAVANMSLPMKDDCPCQCGRVLTGKQKSATVACRKRLQMKREKGTAR